MASKRIYSIYLFQHRFLYRQLSLKTSGSRFKNEDGRIRDGEIIIIVGHGKRSPATQQWMQTQRIWLLFAINQICQFIRHAMWLIGLHFWDIQWNFGALESRITALKWIENTLYACDGWIHFSDVAFVISEPAHALESDLRDQCLPELRNVKSIWLIHLENLYEIS